MRFVSLMSFIRNLTTTQVAQFILFGIILLGTTVDARTTGPPTTRGPPTAPTPKPTVRRLDPTTPGVTKPKTTIPDFFVESTIFNPNDRKTTTLTPVGSASGSRCSVFIILSAVLVPLILPRYLLQ